MSNSFKKVPYYNGAGGGESNKFSKKVSNHKFRQRTSIAILNEGQLPMKSREVMSTTEFAGEGKYYNPTASKRELSK